jgi:pectate lyase
MELKGTNEMRNSHQHGILPALRFTAVLFGLAAMPVSASVLPAFPGAEGYGSGTSGGRGGRVIPVTNLNPSGSGSLQAACEAEGPRIVVFKVAGTIDGNVRIRNDHITIAGQTAPGDGVTIKGHLGIGANDVIVRYIRVRYDGDGGAGDAIGGRGRKNIILDHVSASWGTDEVLSVYVCENVTIQNCIISEAIGNGETHKFGGIWGDKYSTHHHNLFAHNQARNPRLTSHIQVDFRNNVLYNWEYNTAHGGHEPDTRINMVANYYKPGPATRSAKSRIAQPMTRGGAAGFGKWWVSGNFVEGSPEVTSDNWLGVQPQEGELSDLRLDEPWPAMPIAPQSAEEAYETVLAHAGCSLPKRDLVDVRIIEEVRSGTATLGENGIISCVDDVGGWPELKSGPVPADSDGDGMPDEWEIRHGFDPKDPSDGPKDKDGDGYTNLEEFLNGTDPTKFVDYTKPENNVNTLYNRGTERTHP